MRFQSRRSDRRSVRLRWLMRWRRVFWQNDTIWSVSWLSESSTDFCRRSTM